jgi:uncharacterized membrane protein YqaE (UPF0057 family)
MTPGQIVAALLLPPLAIFFAEGVGRNFWIGLALTCLGYLPGVIYAFFVLLRGRSTSTITTTTSPSTAT